MVGMTRLERATSRSRTVRSTKLSYIPIFLFKKQGKKYNTVYLDGCQLAEAGVF